MTGHCFRSIASTYLNNLGTIRPDMIEAQLAPGVRDEVRAACNRVDYEPHTENYRAVLIPRSKLQCALF